MPDDSNSLSLSNDLTPEGLRILKEKRKELRRRLNVLKGARAYLGDKADQELLNELEEVQRQFRQLDQRIKRAGQPVETPIYDIAYAVSREAVPEEFTRHMRVAPENTGISYVLLEEAGTLELVYEGSTPSLSDFSLFNLALSRLVNQGSLGLAGVASRCSRIAKVVVWWHHRS